MLLYLNPFAWGMRRMPQYNPSIKTSKLIDVLNQKYNLQMNIGEVVDTLWYFRDLDNNKITKLENFELNNSNDDSLIKKDVFDKYALDFLKSFEHKKYFDSLKVITNNDNIVYKSKMK